MNYHESLEYLKWLGHETLTAKYGLEKITRMMAECGDPHRAYPSIIIAGTNGKGSVAAMLDAILQRAGRRVGLYTSPHLMRIEERFRVNGREISPEDFAALATEVRRVSDRLLERGDIDSRPSFFEFVTAMGFEYFRRQAVELLVLEVGLGGRLDATSVVPPFLSVITSIDIDHEQYLGSTIELIAAEKAAIIKPGSRVVIARQKPEALAVLLARCQHCQVEPVYAGSGVHITRVEPDGHFGIEYQLESGHMLSVRLGLRGRHQIENALAAIKTIEALSQLGYLIPEEAIAEGLESVEWPGRMEIVSDRNPLVLLDGAHNVAGARVVRHYLEEFGRKPITLIFAVMRDKRIREMADELFPLAETIILTKVQDPRGADLSLLAEVAAPYPHVRLAESTGVALSLAERIAARTGMICVTGSLYLVREAKQWLASHMSHPSGNDGPSKV